MSPNKPESYSFGPFKLDPRGVLWEADAQTGKMNPVPLTDKSFQILLLLVSRGGEPLSTKLILDEVWPGVYVEPSNVVVRIPEIRKALGDDQRPYKYIATRPKQRYVFIAPVEKSRGREAPATPDVDFGSLGTIHVHVDGVDADEIVYDLVSEFNAREIPKPSKINGILEDEPGPQRAKKPETYGVHTPGGIEERKRLEYFSSHLFGSFATTKRELRQLLFKLHNAGINDKDIVVEAERIIGKFGNGNGDGDWTWATTFLRDYPSLSSADVGFQKLDSDSIEIHFGIDIPRTGRWQDTAPLTCKELCDLTNKLDIEVGGWFRFDKQEPARWAFRSNMFDVDVDRSEIDQFRRRLAEQLAAVGQRKQFDWRLKAVVEQAIGIWQIPLTPYNGLVSLAELADWEAKYPNLRDFWVVTPNFLGDKNTDIENAMLRNLGPRSGATYTYFIRSIADYRRLQNFVQSLSQNTQVDDVYGKIKAVMVVEDISRRDDVDTVFRDGGCFIANPLSALDTSTVDDADGYLLVRSETNPGEIVGAKLMDYAHLKQIVRLLKPLTETHSVQGLQMNLSQQKPEPMRGAIVCLETKELMQLINDIEEKSNAETLQHYDLAIASVVSQLGGQVARSIERGYLIILPNVKAAIPCAQELVSFAKAKSVSQKIAIDFGDVWKVMRAHGNDYCGRRVSRCRELLNKTKFGEVRITSSLVDMLPGTLPSNIVETKPLNFNNRDLTTFTLEE